MSGHLYRYLSLLTALAVLLNIAPVSMGNPVQAAPPASDLAVPLVQAPTFTVRGAARNRDGAPLSGAAISVSAYNGPYAGQPPSAGDCFIPVDAFPNRRESHPSHCALHTFEVPWTLSQP
jgi:hypothetical protein